LYLYFRRWERDEGSFFLFGRRIFKKYLKHPEFGTIPVGVVEFDTPEAAHRCCRDIDNFGDDGSRVCLLGTRIRSFTRQR